MSNKHDPLSEEDVKRFELKAYVLQVIDQYKRNNPEKTNADLKILDWGCGRGTSVIKLLDAGYDAYGVEIDKETISKGHALLKHRGYDPAEKLLHVADTTNFPDGSFDIIFSEQVLEHVKGLDEVVKEISRLTKHSGLGVHAFPGSRTVVEVHLLMPFVHWLPKGIIRFVFIYLFVISGRFPKWPETTGKGSLGITKVFYNYANNKTYYRDIKKIMRIFKRYGLVSQYSFQFGKKDGFLPDLFYRNAFPKGSIFLFTKKQ